jgi:hypothetical protein
LARTLRRPTLILALPAVVGLSALLHWLAARRIQGLWIMPDEAIYGTRALALWQNGSLPLIRGSGAGYSALYPLLAGGPLSIGTLSTGYALLKPVQALLMSAAAWPVYSFTAALVPRRFALAAAALTVAAPIVLFSGLLMTEVFFYPVSAIALFAVARAVATPRLANQAAALVLIAVATATRIQGIVFLPVFALAVVVHAALGRTRPRLRPFWPVWTVCVLGILLTAAKPGAFGAYTPAISHGYALGPAGRLSYDHLAYLVAAVGVIPIAALVLLTLECLRGREPDPRVRAVVAVAIAACALVVLEVGVFASHYSPHLLGRDLAALPPFLFSVFALWLGRGAPRPLQAASVTALALLAIIVFAPWNALTTPDAFPDTPDLGFLLANPVGVSAATTVAIGAAVLLLLWLFVPRSAVVLPVVLLALLAGSSLAASDQIRKVDASTQAALVGSPRNWVERAVPGHVTFVFDGDLASWGVVWQQRFWNPALDRVVSIAPNFVPGPIAQKQVRPGGDGRLPTTDRYVITNDIVAMVGEPVAHQSRGPDQFGLTLWKLSGPPRISMTRSGFLPNGDIIGPAKVTAYGCAAGTLELTLLPKDTQTLRIELDGRTVIRENISGEPSWQGTVHVPANHGPAPCVFTLLGGSLLGSTQINFAAQS